MFDRRLTVYKVLPFLIRSCLAVLSSIIFWKIWQPDPFGLVPNSLDPFFYTGYGANFDDALKSVGDDYYFVSRWSAYYPVHLLSLLMDPFSARIIWRLILTVATFEMFWQIGKKYEFKPHSRIVGSIVVLSSPVFLRAFLTDYPEYIVMSLGIFTFGLTLFRPKPVNAAILGALLALIFIANPFAIGFCIVVVIARTLVWRKEYSLSKYMVDGGLILSGFISIVAIGYLTFRYRYGIPNVYYPTIDFLKNYVPPVPDPWRTADKSWISHFSWIYLLPILVPVVLIVQKFVQNQATAIAIRVSSITALALYLFHWIMQIERGHALETSHYWSMSLPPVMVLLFFIVAVLSDVATKFVSFGVMLILLLLLLTTTPDFLTLPAGIAMYAVLIFAVCAVIVAIKNHRGLGLFLFTFFFLLIQIGAPTYKTQTYGGDFNSPVYEDVIRKRSFQSKQIVAETSWFLKSMDEYKYDWNSYFIAAGGWSLSIIGTYIVHPAGRWHSYLGGNLDKIIQPLSEISFRKKKSITIYGDPDLVAAALEKIEERISDFNLVIDRTSTILSYRLVVIDTDLNEKSMKFLMTDFKYTGGITSDKEAKLSAADGVNGIWMYGPYINLPKGRYRLSLSIESSVDGSVGSVQVSDNKTGFTKEADLLSSTQTSNDIDFDFTVAQSSGVWEFRVKVLDNTDLAISNVMITKIN